MYHCASFHIFLLKYSSFGGAYEAQPWQSWMTIAVWKQHEHAQWMQMAFAELTVESTIEESA